MIGTFLDKFCDGLRVLLGVLMGALAIPVAMQVISRYTGIIPSYLWTEELSTFIFVWIVMIGSMVAVWDGTHFDVRVIPDAMSPLLRLLQNAFVHIAILFFGVLFAYYGLEYVEFGNNQRSVMMRANLAITYVSVPIAGVMWTVFSAYRIWEEFRAYRQAGSKRI
ncbi:TRAP-type C4-dicarboxylate transport system permease small subunit [Yoonia maricola]|uniref:TRAP transporter small permease protein n=1 Tax=Yoonia maricola TaxID=420999 RepID=A0A2M8W363_9RHOB|nr:TRAP transporter small permease [Yoonia maricola]PJI85382.1 TRAP-type C4-dicarboxylate transport system permease small subunit [Yoonia maricola]